MNTKHNPPMSAIADSVVVLLDPDDVEDGGVVLPEDTSPNDTGVIVSAGNWAEYVEVGERVLVDRNTGKVHKYQGREYLVMSEDDVLAVIED